MFSRKSRKSSTKALKKKFDSKKLSDMENNISKTVTIVPVRFEKAKVKYSVSQTVNNKFLMSLKILEELSPYIKETGYSKGEYERNVLKPLRRIIRGQVKSKGGDGKNTTSKPNSFERLRKASDNFNKLYDKLASEGVDLSNVIYKNNEISLINSAKVVRLYFKEHNLKYKSRYFSTDKFIDDLFGSRLDKLYEKNGSKIISQGQLQTLASWLVDDIGKR
jgi:hypothetical protein